MRWADKGGDAADGGYSECRGVDGRPGGRGRGRQPRWGPQGPRTSSRGRGEDVEALRDTVRSAF